MQFIVSIVFIITCVLGGYTAHGGKLAVLWQPTEVVIICGAAIGAFVIGNPMFVIKRAGKSLKYLIKGMPYNRKHYLEMLSMLFAVFKLIKSKGMLEIESHIESPHESELFKRFPLFVADHHALDFLCDNLRILTMGVDNHMTMEEMIDKELEVHHHELTNAAGAVSSIADGMPALGIVAAVLGVIITMGSISEPPEVLGKLIGAALVGTFLGVFIAYGFVGPMGSFLTKYAENEGQFYNCLKIGLIANMQGNAPIVTVEFVRKNIPSHCRPSFKELEQTVNEQPAG